MRDEMIGAVVRRALEYPEFRQRLIDDPQHALEDHGFALEERELHEIESIGKRLNETSSTDAEKELVTIAEKYGVVPGRMK